MILKKKTQPIKAEIVAIRDLFCDGLFNVLETQKDIQQISIFKTIDPYTNIDVQNNQYQLTELVLSKIRSEISKLEANVFILVQGITGRLLLDSIDVKNQNIAGLIWINPIHQIKKGKLLILCSRFLSIFIVLWRKIYLSKLFHSKIEKSVKKRIQSQIVYDMCLKPKNLIANKYEFTVLLLCSDKHDLESVNFAEKLNQQFQNSEIVRFIHLGFDLLNEDAKLVCKYIKDFIVNSMQPIGWKKRIQTKMKN